MNPEQECDRNAGNGGVFLWLEREKERKRGQVGDPADLRRFKTNLFSPSLSTVLQLLLNTQQIQMC